MLLVKSSGCVRTEHLDALHRRHVLRHRLGGEQHPSTDSAQDAADHRHFLQGVSKKKRAELQNMENIKPPAEFVPYNGEKKWETWREAFEIFSIAADLESMPLEGQGITEFVTELKQLAQECEFEELAESLIRDRFIIGMIDQEVKKKLLEDPQLTLPKAISVATIAESVCLQIASWEEKQVMIEKINKNTWEKNRSRVEKAKAGPSIANPRNECKWGGQQHTYGNCPAYRKTCNACGKLNHFAAVCRTKRIRNLIAENEGDESFEGGINVNKVLVKTVRSDKWSAVISINGNKTSEHLDTGAQINVLPQKVISLWPAKPIIKPTSLKAYAYGHSELPIVGKCEVLCQYGEKKSLCEFIIADVDAQTLITGDTCEKLEILKRINQINSHEMILHDQTKEILEQFHEVFQGVGVINSECKMYTKPEYPPVRALPRRIPASLGNEVQSELEKMIKQGIITKIYHETEWSHPMVVVKKKSGQIRICLDPRKLNQALVRRHFQTPAPSELLHQIPKADYYTVLDVKSAYWHVPVANECRDLLVMATPFGKFRYNRLPFGLNISAQIFVEMMTNIFKNSFWNVTYVDDLLIYADSIEEHNEKLKGILEIARRNNIKFDLTKAQICKKEDEKLITLQKDTREDTTLLKIIHYVIEGWPISKKDVDEDVKPYYDCRHRIYLWNELLCVGSAIVVPGTQRNYMLELLHKSHQGISAIQGLARESLFWPGMSMDIAERVKSCDICQKYQKSKTRETLRSFPIPDYPWQTVSMDIFYIERKPHLLIVDRFSGYPEVYALNPPTATNVRNKLRETFARFGIPETIMSDNGPPFHSEIMTDFCTKWGIRQIFSSPHLHRSNGLAERNIQTIKTLLNKCKDQGSDAYLALLTYRNTPKNDLPSPAQLCLSRSLRCLIPRITPLYGPCKTNQRHIENAKKRRQNSMKKYYDRSSKIYPKVSVGEEACCQVSPKQAWTPVKITAHGNSPQSFKVETPSGKEFLRNQQFLRPKNGPSGKGESPSLGTSFSGESSPVAADSSSWQRTTEEEPVAGPSTTPIQRQPSDGMAVPSENSSVMPRFSRFGRELKKPQRL
ncbi:K02A2.6-like, partial [Cordylochernes scorpioides]